MKEFHKISWLHQVFIVDNFQVPDKLPENLERNAQLARDLYPDAKYKIWGGEELRYFIGDKLGTEVLTAFDTLAPYSYKCDLARYCLMYVYGGIYFDLAIKLLNPWNIPRRYGVAAFMENYDGMECWVCTQTTPLWSLPGRPEWQIAIDNVVANTQNRFYGPHDHYPTAGALLGRSFAASMALKGQSTEADDQYLGEVRYITPERQPQNVVYVSPDKVLVGQRNKLKAGDVTELGMTGTNNYCDMWRAKQAYGEEDHIWLPSDHNIVIDEVGILTESGIVVAHGEKGRVMYGPFVSLKAGQYKLIFEFDNNTTFKNLLVDISSGYGSDTVAHHEIKKDEKVATHEHAVFFSLERDVRDVEFRVNVFGDFEGTISRICLKKVEEIFWLAKDKDFTVDEVGEKTKQGITIREGQSGRVMYGPFIKLPRGQYKLILGFSENTVFRDLFLDVSTNWGSDVVAEFNRTHHTRNIRDEECFVFKLLNDEDCVEFRMTVYGDFEGTLRDIRLVNMGALLIPYTDPRIQLIDVHRTSGGIVINKSHQGRVVYGPYISLSPGKYEVEAVFSDDSDCRGITLDVCSNSGDLSIEKNTPKDKTKTIKCNFVLSEEVSDVEFRLETKGKYSSTFEYFIISTPDVEGEVNKTPAIPSIINSELDESFLKKIKRKFF
ncbi:hypothetical protein GS501_09075 [Saccharibacter sp. 17.LH.SD]|uniref:glycosyltransferase n=1 Tax=Saccharibacter sp. 17.LH.SD TaxID=2689393 RepID=UPI00136CF36E|nr:glycosyltransferase [Saccharibacter sp. 17.LH.SD]MXV45183.1 hypothetical protein [Saccharibacter sp. 17.LH.SD]